MAINFSDLGGGGGGPAMRIDRITSTGTWTCPDDVTEVEVALAGGGGSGAAWSNSPSSGGGGSLEIERLTVVPGTTYTVTIGSGGARVNSQSPGNPGNPSSFGNLLTANGGLGGYSNTIPNSGMTSHGGYPTGEVNVNSNSVTTAVSQAAKNGRILGGSIFEGYLVGGAGGSNNYNAGVLMGGPGSGTTAGSLNGVQNTGAGGMGGYNQSAGNTGAGGSGVCIIRYWSAA